MGSVAGVVNASGNGIVIGANSSSLTTGAIDATGDPLMFSPVALDITTSVSTMGQPLSYVSGGDIDIASGVILNTTGATNGGSVVMIAGRDF